jgi:AraC-like DNA-binding protein
MMQKNDISTSFFSKQPLGNDDIVLLGWSGTQWDNISYFPKNYQIAFIEKGEGAIIVGDVAHQVTEGQFFLIHPNLIHNGKPNFETGWSVKTLVFKNTFVEKLFENEVLPTFKTLVFEDDNYTDIFKKCYQILDSQGFKLDKESKSNLFLQCYELLSIPSEKTKSLSQKEENDALQNAISFIEINYKEEISVEELAKKVFLSKFHFIRSFKKQTGLTPHNYQMQLKLNEARRLIFKRKSLTEVAFELGFADQAHFTNTFKRYANGANPRDLLKTAISFNFKE